MNARVGHNVLRGTGKNSGARTAFTLIEMLVVIAIIGILLALGIPMLKGMNKSNSMAAADRQMLDDINYARQRAIADHTSVYIVFMPPLIPPYDTAFPIYPNANAQVSKTTSNLYGGQLTTYALISLRSVGEQPGRSTPRYLTSWRSLPSGVYIATNKFFAVTTPPGLAPPFFVSNRPEFPFPVATNMPQGKLDFQLPHFGFNFLGQLIYRSNSVDHLVYTQGDSANQMYIPLVRGSIFFQHDQASGNYLPQVGDVAETQRGTAYYAFYNSTNTLIGAALPSPYNTNSYNQIYVDPLTGRAKVQRMQIQ